MWRVVLLALSPLPALACDRPVCVVAADPAAFAQVLTFAANPATLGPGQPVSGLLTLPGVTFGERFAGQRQGPDALYDQISGPAALPVTLLAGAQGRNLSLLRVFGANLLSGNGPTGYPRDDSTGEGAIAIRFDHNQTAFALDLVGGEGGQAQILFLGPDGAVLDLLTIAPLAEGWLAFQTGQGWPPVLGLVLSNRDTAGIALRAVAFDLDERVS